MSVYGIYLIEIQEPCACTYVYYVSTSLKLTGSLKPSILNSEPSPHSRIRDFKKQVWLLKKARGDLMFLFPTNNRCRCLLLNQPLFSVSLSISDLFFSQISLSLLCERNERILVQIRNGYITKTEHNSYMYKWYCT